MTHVSLSIWLLPRDWFPPNIWRSSWCRRYEFGPFQLTISQD